MKRRQNAGFLSPRSSKIRVTKKKERRKRKSEEKRRATTMAALLVFIMATLEIFGRKKELLVFIMATLEIFGRKKELLDAKGLFGDTFSKIRPQL